MAGSDCEGGCGGGRKWPPHSLTHNLTVTVTDPHSTVSHPQSPTVTEESDSEATRSLPPSLRPQPTVRPQSVHSPRSSTDQRRPSVAYKRRGPPTKPATPADDLFAFRSVPSFLPLTFAIMHWRTKRAATPRRRDLLTYLLAPVATVSGFFCRWAMSLCRGGTEVARSAHSR